MVIRIIMSIQFYVVQLKVYNYHFTSSCEFGSTSWLKRSLTIFTFPLTHAYFKAVQPFYSTNNKLDSSVTYNSHITVILSFTPLCNTYRVLDVAVSLIAEKQLNARLMASVTSKHQCRAAATLWRSYCLRVHNMH